MILKLKDIQRQPTTLEKVHESCYRSYHILEQVLQMVERVDSKETIFEVVDMLREYPLDTEFKKPECGDAGLLPTKPQTKYKF